MKRRWKVQAFVLDNEQKRHPYEARFFRTHVFAKRWRNLLLTDNPDGGVLLERVY